MMRLSKNGEPHFHLSLNYLTVLLAALPPLASFEIDLGKSFVR